MKQVFLSGQGSVAVIESPVPGRLAGSILVQNAFSLISAGTEGAAITRSSGLKGLYEKILKSRDKGRIVWNMVQTQGVSETLSLIQGKLGDYTPLGYSCSGVVLEVDGPDTGFKPGQRVACMGAGFANHAEYVVVPKNLAAVLPDGVEFAEAAFASFACIAMQGIRRLELSPGERVAVVGLGQIGQIALRLAVAMGYQACGFDIDQKRVDHAKEYSGVTVVANSISSDPLSVVHEMTAGKGVDGVVICASAKSDMIINQAFNMCRKRGRVSVIGDIGLALDRARMYAKELEVRLSCSYGAGRYDPDYELLGQDYPLPYVRWTEGRNLEHFLALLSEKRLSVRDLISEKVEVAKARHAYSLIKSADSDVYGVLLDYHLPARPALPENPFSCHYHSESQGLGADTIQIGLIGTGGYAKNVHIPNLRKISNVSIRGVASKAGASAAVVARKEGAGYSTSDAKELFADPDLDAVVISTRHSSHAGLVLDALEAEKHIFVEKPMAITVEDCMRIVKAQQKSRKVVRVGFNRRFAPFLREMKRVVGQGKKIFNIRVNVGAVGDHWSNTIEEGGRFLGEGVHFFDLANWMIGCRPLLVTAHFLGEADVLNPDAAITVSYEDGSIANIVYTTKGHTALGKEYFEVFSNNRAVVLDDYRLLKGYGCKVSVSRKNKGCKGQLEALEEFIETVRTGNGAGGADEISGLLATAIAVASLTSAQQGKNIDLSEFVRNHTVQ